MILAGDAGGTKVRLALFDKEGNTFARRALSDFPSRDYESLDAIVQAFLEQQGQPVERAVFGVPGPVKDGVAQPTNLPWDADERRIARNTGIPWVRVVNDLYAMTASIPHLAPEDVMTLHAGEPPGDNPRAAVLAPGTGLGQGYLTWHQGRRQVLASEGGHVDFAPNTALEVELLQYLMKRFDHVSYERVLSGQGLRFIYDFLKDAKKAAAPEALERRMRERDPAAEIATAALAQEFEICVQALDLFVAIMGAQAGNMALTLLTDGGVFLGGGIPPKIITKLRDGTLVNAYLRKGRVSHVVERISLHVILDDRTALLGAASLAFE